MTVPRTWQQGRAVERDDHEDAQQRLQHQEHLAKVGEMTAGVAHDFNNIISAISLYTELLEFHQGFDDAGREHVRAIHQQVDRAHVLVWQILDSAHRSPLELVDVDLSALLAGLRPVLRRILPDDVGISLVDEGGPCVVQGDPTRLQQIFLNLATNASAAFDGPGTLCMTLAAAEAPDVELPAPPDGRQWVRATISDDGRGMPPEVLARAFEPFFTTKPRGSGTGLGLSQVRGLVSQHEAHIVIDSSPGEGTTVSIWLRGAEPTRRPAPTTLVEIPRGHGERLAVVDDDPAARACVGRILESLGYVVELANGHEALTALEREPSSFSAVVTDASTAHVDGEELARIVADRWPSLPIILISGYRAPAETATGAGESRVSCDDHVIRLAKPFTRSRLASTLRSALR